MFVLPVPWTGRFPRTPEPLVAIQRVRPSRIDREKVRNHGDELAPEGFQFLGWQSAEKRFQNDRGLAHARIQVIAQNFQLPPGTIRKNMTPVGDIGNDGAGLLLYFRSI